MATSPPPAGSTAGSPGRPFSLYLKAPGERRRPSPRFDAVVHLEGPKTPGLCLHHNFRDLWPLPANRQDQVLGFLLFALGAWSADKLAPRRAQPDAWTREFVLELPTVPAWANLTLEMASLLNFLTGDAWTIKPREVRLEVASGETWPHPWQPTAVALFSGGLDSLIGAIDLLEQGHRLVLVSHYDYGQLAAGQQSLAAGLIRHYGPERLVHRGLRVQFEGPELTLRSRSLLYVALGLIAVSAFPGNLPLFIPENGWISLNPPLTLNRLGAYSTRTTHPQFMRDLAALWRQAGLSQELHNPYQDLTKGEMAVRCANLGLLEKLAPLSLSCARPVAGRWQREPAGACGYCYPCLVRRAALHRLGWDRGGDYRVDVLAGPEMLRHRVKGRHLRAVCLALKTWQENPRELPARLHLGRGDPQDLVAQTVAAKRVLEAGLAELAALIREQGQAAVKEFLGEKDAFFDARL
jgi:7-cyano-7-deazaguanine synthase in queuosine biosynthesis